MRRSLGYDADTVQEMAGLRKDAATAMDGLIGGDPDRVVAAAEALQGDAAGYGDDLYHGTVYVPGRESGLNGIVADGEISPGFDDDRATGETGWKDFSSLSVAIAPAASYARRGSLDRDRMETGVNYLSTYVAELPGGYDFSAEDDRAAYREVVESTDEFTITGQDAVLYEQGIEEFLQGVSDRVEHPPEEMVPVVIGLPQGAVDTYLDAERSWHDIPPVKADADGQYPSWEEYREQQIAIDNELLLGDNPTGELKVDRANVDDRATVYAPLEYVDAVKEACADSPVQVRALDALELMHEMVNAPAYEEEGRLHYQHAWEPEGTPAGISFEWVEWDDRPTVIDISR